MSNLEIHAPPNHPGFPNDGTQGDAGFSNAVWISTQTASALSWNAQTFVQNQNANAIRWGHIGHNFGFDSNQPPQAADATIGFIKEQDRRFWLGFRPLRPRIASSTDTHSVFPPGEQRGTTNLSTRMRVEDR